MCLKGWIGTFKESASDNIDDRQFQKADENECMEGIIWTLVVNDVNVL